MKRVGIYCRVSTDLQSTDMQVSDLKRYCVARGWDVAGLYIDEGVSGATTSRPQLDLLMKAARQRQIDVVLVWSFSRFARTLRQLIEALAEFQSLGVDFTSFSESIDTSSPAGKVLFAVLGAFAEFERSVTIERIRGGIRNARLKGVKLGRPRLNMEERIREMRLAGASYREIGRTLHVSQGAIGRALKTAPKTPPASGTGSRA